MSFFPKKFGIVKNRSIFAINSTKYIELVIYIELIILKNWLYNQKE
jgi:hypothetical protein